MFAKVYCFNDTMSREDFLKMFSTEIDSSCIYASQCHASRSDKNTVTRVLYEYFQINLADITKQTKLGHILIFKI